MRRAKDNGDEAARKLHRGKIIIYIKYYILILIINRNLIAIF